ncbi:hypothetical protein PL335_17195 (plasmid) [Sulfitobacter faviae]|uniref:hypothetical protein n=1 Tax=Sulfitobacter faviae TaxID=1775881 RepID=UPI002307DA86|nr:hypothetical protein [Sulfitobacter faviae]WCE68581.1 hypothetical protein PL335_17195 [Sulfitobacter faviae]
MPTFAILPNAGFGSNIFNTRIIDGQGCYYLAKLANTFLILVIVVGCLIFLKSSNQRRLFLLSLLWPASAFYLTGINQQVVFHLLSIFMVIKTLEKRPIWPFLLLSLALISLDRSFISLSVFLAFLITLRLNPRFVLVGFVGLLILSEVAGPYIGQMRFILGPDMVISDITESVAHLEDSIFWSVAIFGSSMVYLGGTATILGFGPEYVFIGVVLMYCSFKRIMDKEVLLFLGSGVLTFLTVISYVPTLQTFRYYIYMLPVFIYFLVPKGRGTIALGGYCVVMQIAYLLQADALYG